MHVVLQTEALAKETETVLVVGLRNREIRSSHRVSEVLRSTFRLNSPNLEFVLCPDFLGVAKNLMIALFSIFYFVRKPEYRIISRNLYACVIVNLLHRSVFIYETHTVETGIRAKLQRWLVRSRKVKCVVISQALKELICAKYSLDNSSVFVLHDAARAGLPDLPKRSKDASMGTVFGYFGSLHQGRGVEIIEEMAARMKESHFLVYGPTEQNEGLVERTVGGSNLKLMGFIDHKDVHNAMSNCDVLLMPYQSQVSIGTAGSDTSKWMSPMKMFEYMASGRPILSSDLPVLREVLTSEKNCLLVPPSDSQSWVDAGKRLNDSNLRKSLSQIARQEYLSKYNWDARAKKLIELL